MRTPLNAVSARHEVSPVRRSAHFERPANPVVQLPVLPARFQPLLALPHAGCGRLYANGVCDGGDEYAICGGGGASDVDGVDGAGDDCDVDGGYAECEGEVDGCGENAISSFLTTWSVLQSEHHPPPWHSHLRRQAECWTA